MLMKFTPYVHAILAIWATALRLDGHFGERY